MQYFERGKKEFVKRLTHTCICVMMHRYSCSKLQLHWYVCIASALVYPLLLPTVQCSPASAQTADMQPMWTCNCFARAIQSALLHSVYFWLLGCLQLLPVHTRVVYKEWVNTVEMFWGYCQWASLALLVALIGSQDTVFTFVNHDYVAHESFKEFWKNSHMRAGFLRRCQNSLWQISPKMMHFQAWKD